MSFSFETLDSADFEYLCKDLAERETGIKLTCHPSGKDGGIDADDFYSDSFHTPKIIIQAKHWEKTNSFSKLENALRKLTRQLGAYIQCNPRLMVFTSMELSRERQKKLQSTGLQEGFQNTQIFDKTKICELLSDSSNADILRKNFKLWIAHTEVLNHLLNRNQFIDCEVFLEDAQLQSRLFVQTTLYDNALECLEKDRIVLIVGDPGTGKTTITKMLALASAADNYTIRYSANNDAHEIKKCLSPDEDARELVVLDDFLGQRCLDVNSRQLNNVMILINFIRRSKRRRLILNSRFSILNEAKSGDDSFRRMMKALDSQIQIVNSDKLSLLDKAQILLANMMHFQVPHSHIASLTATTSRRYIHSSFTDVPGYLDIVSHRNFNPRIIEYVCREDAYSATSSEEYPRYVLSQLKNPTEIWRNEFDKRLSPEDRNFMYVLFSLSDLSSPDFAVRRALEHLIHVDSSIDASKNVYEESLDRLTNSLIRKTIVDNDIHLSVSNPSINDYISSFLARSDAQAARMIEYATYSNQVERIANCNKSSLVVNAVKRLSVDHALPFMPSISSSSRAHYLNAIRTLKIADDGLAQDIAESVQSLSSSDFRDRTCAERYIRTILDDGLIEEMPRLSKALFEPEALKTIVKGFEIGTISACHAFVEELSSTEQNRHTVSEIINAELKTKIESNAYSFVDDRVFDRSQECAQDLLIFDEDAKCFIKEEADMCALTQRCFDSLMRDLEEWQNDVYYELNEIDEISFPEDMLSSIYERAAKATVETTDFQWLFEHDSSFSKPRSTPDEELETIKVRLLFSEYSGSSQHPEK